MKEKWGRKRQKKEKKKSVTGKGDKTMRKNIN